MANKTTKKKRSLSAIRQFMLVATSLACGYLLAIFYDLKQLNEWFNFSNKSFIVNNDVKKLQPKLEFYTLLAKPTAVQTAAPVSSPPVVELQTPVAANTNTVSVKESTVPARNAYMLQLASFQRSEDAERLKARLIMSGFDVQIHPVLQKTTTWYRVVLGPFATRLDAQQMQIAVSRRQRIVGIIRKSDV